jgi:hypothetical protein
MEANTPQTPAASSPPNSPSGHEPITERAVPGERLEGPGPERHADGDGLLESITDAIERLSELDPADAAAPGAAIADVLSQALEEEER